ncbi:MAG TPA: type II and III secretion system protein family protein [Caulobacteraceae bacterium]|nr:type II and III secretion system protein family protein [Caulobacteraceae bacterium]
MRGFNPSKAARRLLLAAGSALALTALHPAPALAIEGVRDASMRSIEVPKDKSAAFRLDYPFSQIVVAQPDTAQLVATTDHSFYIRGKALGVTNLLIYDAQHHLAQVIDVRVGLDVDSLQSDLAAALPGEHITASNFAGGILLSGTASSTGAAEHAKDIAERYAPKAVTSTIAVTHNQQIMVEVRFIEASRNTLNDLGFNLNVSGPGNVGFNLNPGTTLVTQAPIQAGGRIGAYSFEAQLAALEQKGVIRTLARPNLMAMSGQEASFLAGGQIPYPVPNGIQGVTIQFQPYGVKLTVTPTIEDNGEIKLQVVPDVSALDQANAVSINGFTMPALTESKASTTVELRDGQSFAIAGLFQQEYDNTVHQVPGLMSLPVLGLLFRSTQWQHHQTELIIIVTPKLTSPADSADSLPNPLAETREPSPIDLALHGVDERQGAAPKVDW